MNYAWFTFAVFVIYFLYPTSASLGFGGCNKKLYEKDNDYKLDKMVGVWYENDSKSRIMAPLHNSCPTIEIYKEPSGTIKIVRRQRIEAKKRSYTLVGTAARTRDDKNHYTYTIGYKKEQNEDLSDDTDIMYKIIDTDYNCWAVVYACLSALKMHEDDVMVLVKRRSKTCLNQKTKEEVNNVLKILGTNLSKFNAVDHDHDLCSLYYPDFY